ncbi:hypothetical protein BpHYR1_013366 [Brachionus plicatilis]|uniref:SWIM-type domain-containing protein n=1 Tax=Brachionus plicatilis TaxID=10195 RepID=A0A3M7PNX0_BRAPC|nr:hypothetical protein BpHYR1_013366 [Brachionus plicatilis]
MIDDCDHANEIDEDKDYEYHLYNFCTKIHNATCTCVYWLKHYKCSHTIALAYRLKLVNFNNIVMDLLVSNKRKKCTSKKNSKSLQHQSTDLSSNEKRKESTSNQKNIFRYSNYKLNCISKFRKKAYDQKKTEFLGILKFRIKKIRSNTTIAKLDLVSLHRSPAVAYYYYYT